MAGRYRGRVNNLFSPPPLRQGRLAGLLGFFQKLVPPAPNRPVGCPKRGVKRVRAGRKRSSFNRRWYKATVRFRKP